MNENNKRNVGVINMHSEESYLVSYSENFNKDGFMNWGSDNFAPKYYRGLMRKSGLHSTLVRSKASMIGGNGFKKTDLSESALSFINNEFNDLDLEEILAKIAFDMEVMGAYALNIVWDEDLEYIEQINYILVDNVRIYRKVKNGFWGYQKVNNKEEDGQSELITSDEEIEQYWYSDNWENVASYPKRAFDVFNPEVRRNRSTILMVLDSNCDIHRFYPEPSYVAAIDAIEAEASIKRFERSQLDNGFYPSLLITDYAQFNASDDDKDAYVRMLESKFEGAANAGRVMVSFAPDANSKPAIETIQSNNADKMFIEMRKDTRDAIIETHRISSRELFGIATPGELGGNKNILQDLAKFQSDYIGPKQREIEKIINWLADVNGIEDKIEIELYKIRPAVVASDLLAVLGSTITPEQKVNVLQAMGYDQETADKLVNSGAKPMNNAPTE